MTGEGGGDEATTLNSTVEAALSAALPLARPREALLAGRGWDVTAWRVPAPDGDWLARVPRSARAHPAIEAQHCLGLRLHEAGLPVPRDWRLLRARDGALLAGLYRYVEGRHAVVRGQPARRRLAAQLGDFLSRLHALDPSVAADCGARPSEPWRDTFAPMLDRSLPLLPEWTQAWLRAVGDALARASATMPPPVVVHADLKPEHVLLDESGAVAAILDFEGAQVSDAAFEFGRLWQNWDAAFARLTLSHYTGAVDDAFMERARCYVALDPLWVFHDATAHDLPEWIPWARRVMAARADAWTRSGRPR